jgi:hypothetical protein
MRSAVSTPERPGSGSGRTGALIELPAVASGRRRDDSSSVSYLARRDAAVELENLGIRANPR